MESPASLPARPVSPTSLAAAVQMMVDPRRAASVISPLPALLAMAAAAIFANHLSVLAIAEWGRDKPQRCWSRVAFPYESDERRDSGLVIIAPGATVDDVGGRPKFRYLGEVPVSAAW